MFTPVCTYIIYVDCVRNVMSHAQKPNFVIRRNGRVHLNRRWASVQSTSGNRGVRISGSNARYTMFRGSVKGTDYPLHSPFSPSLPLPCVTVCHHISTVRVQLKCAGTRAETRFRLSAKWTSPFKSVVTVSSVDCWQSRCAHQR